LRQCRLEKLRFQNGLRPYDYEQPAFSEGPEGVKWELGFTFFRGWEMGFCMGFMEKKTIERWEWDFNLSNSLGLWNLSWDLKKTICWEMGLGAPLQDLLFKFLQFEERFSKSFVFKKLSFQISAMWYGRLL